jgi:hypothetical protein
MQKTIVSGSNTIGTFSCWVKRCTFGADQAIFTSTNDTLWFKIWFHNEDYLRIDRFTGSAWTILKTTSMKFRDPSAWYHIHVALDTTDGTEEDRMVLTVNGTRVTSFASSTNAAEDASLLIGEADYVHRIGANQTSGDFFDGYLAEVVWLDGTASAASNFGEFNEDSPTIWQPKNVSGLAFGTNGYYLDFEASDNLGNDANGGTDLTESNLAATDQATDTPTNNFATANPLNVNSGGVATFAEGNTEVTSPTATGMQFMSSSTLGMTAGKWYCEVKIKTVDSGLWGVSANVAEDARGDYPPGTQGGAQSVGLLGDNGNRYIDDGGATHGAGFSDDDIGMIALDLDNNNVYFGKNGSWFDGSGNADESSPNSAISVTAVGSTTDGAYFFSCGDGGGSATHKVQWNFGNPPYANSSSVSDANGYGAFEYTVPSGYLALCTKNLGSTGG